jgi:hypothetical protein
MSGETVHPFAFRDQSRGHACLLAGKEEAHDISESAASGRLCNAAGVRLGWTHVPRRAYDAPMLTRQERERYFRQIAIEGFGEEGQEKLSRARAFVAGAGGLGCAACTYLAAAGVGALRFVDGGEVEPSNLNRQVLYGVRDVEKAKAPVLQAGLAEVNPGVRCETFHAAITEESDSIHYSLALGQMAGGELPRSPRTDVARGGGWCKT